MSTRFNTLILREWMQHKRGWLITMLAPPAIFLALLPFGQVEGISEHGPLGVALLGLLICTAAVFGISYAAALFQLPGLARRDQQDRSIEFWLSLPASHSESIGATVLMHALLVPLAAALVGFAFGGLIASGLVIKTGGLSSWAAVPWFSAIGIAIPVLLRGLLGIVLMSLWLAPLMLIVMTASAWLKRWGVPAVGIAVGVSGLVLDKIYGLRIVWEVLGAQFEGAGNALLASPESLGQQMQQMERTGTPLSTLAWAREDALLALQGLASPHLIGGLLVAAGCFALLVYKRNHNH